VCQVTLEEIPTPIPKQNPTSGALTSHRTTVVTAGDTLQSIAYREYRNPNLWRAIAEANDIDDPLRLPSGTQLLLPAPPEAAEADELARLQPL
jgi:nucleoid-associated protein YgaU